MDATRSGEVLARHAGIDKETGQLAAGEDEGPRRLVISSDFYAVYESAGNRADGIVNLYCWAHARRHFVRAGDANPAQLGFWVKAWLDRVRDLYAAHRQLTATRREAAPLDAALAAWARPRTLTGASHYRAWRGWCLVRADWDGNLARPTHLDRSSKRAHGDEFA